MSRKIVGLDIKETSLSAVLVMGGIKGNRIEDHRIVSWSVDQEEESLLSALDTVLSEMDIQGATCIASLPASLASYRNVKVPFKEKKKLRQILPFELESILPYPPENVIIDFELLSSPADAEQHQIFATAVQKEKVAWYLDLLASRGIEPEVLTIDGYALAQALAVFSDDKGDRLLVSIEPHLATLFLLHDGKVSLVRSCRVDMSHAAGANYLSSTILQTIDGFQKHTGLRVDVQEAILTGSALEDSHVEPAVREHLDIPVRTMDLIALSGQVSIDTEGIMWKTATMDASLALAMSAIIGFDLINFRREGFTAQKGWVQYQNDILKTALVALVMVLLFFANFVMDYVTIKKRSIRLENEVRDVFTSTFPEVTRVVDPLQQMRVKLQELKKEATFKADTNRTVLAIDVLNDISRHIPEQIEVELSNIIINADSVLISGETGGFDAVDDVKNSLEDADLFKNVSSTSSNKDRNGNRVRFKIKAVI
jgi:Tfp pilus assembly PilM family ATPase/Tfp pilus assembly protein PilN